MTTDDFVNSEELANRPRAILTLAVGPTWALLDDYEQVTDQVNDAPPGARLEFNTHQENGLGSAGIFIRADQIVSVFEVTEERYISDLADRKEKEQMMREAAMAQRGAPPPGLV